MSKDAAAPPAGKHHRDAKRPSSSAAALLRVEQLLLDGRAHEALDALRGAADHDPLIQNARGVCLLRLGHAREAVALYRKLALHENELTLDLTQPLAFITNFATALLLDKNVRGCRETLFELGQEQHPSVVRLRESIDRWKKRLPWWPRLLFSVYGEVRRPIELDFAPGDLVSDANPKTPVHQPSV